MLWGWGFNGNGLGKRKHPGGMVLAVNAERTSRWESWADEDADNLSGINYIMDLAGMKEPRLDLSVVVDSFNS